MFNRATISRAAVIGVALSLTAACTNAGAREFRAADTQSEDDPTIQALRYMDHLSAESSGGRHQVREFRSHQLGEEKETIEQTRAGREAVARSSRFMREKWKDREDRSRWQTENAGVTIVTDFERKPFEAAMAGIYASMQRDPAAAGLIERIRKVE